MFLYYANEENDDVIGCSIKTVQHSIKNISRNIKAILFKLATRNVHHKSKRMTATMLQSKTFVSCSGNIIKVKKFYKLEAES